MSELICQPCGDEGRQLKAFGCCLDCSELLCNDCYEIHCKPRPMRNHQLLNMEVLIRVKALFGSIPGKAGRLGDAGATRAAEYGVENSSTEYTGDAEPIMTKAKHLKDIYIRYEKDIDKLEFCNVQAMASFANDTVAILKGENVFLLDTNRNKIISEMETKVKNGPNYRKMLKLNESQIALFSQSHSLIGLLRVEKMVTPERSVGMPGFPSEPICLFDNKLFFNQYNSEARNYMIIKVDMRGNTTEEWMTQSKKPFSSFAIYEIGDNTHIYGIIDDQGLTHGTLMPHVKMENVVLDQSLCNQHKLEKPKYVTMDDEGKQLFVVYANDVIVVLRAGTREAHILLDAQAGLHKVSVISYCSHTRQLAVAMERNNYIKIYQLS